MSWRPKVAEPYVCTKVAELNGQWQQLWFPHSGCLTTEKFTAEIFYIPICSLKLRKETKFHLCIHRAFLLAPDLRRDRQSVRLCRVDDANKRSTRCLIEPTDLPAV